MGRRWSYIYWFNMEKEGSETMTEGLKEKSKTAEEINLQIQEMVKRNRKEHGAYSFEEIQEISKRKWVLVSVAQQEIDDCRTSWQNLKDTIPKFDHKISFLENQIKSDNELIEISQRARHELERESGLLKQKLCLIIEKAKRYSKESMDFAGYDRIAEELEELLRE